MHTHTHIYISISASISTPSSILGDDYFDHPDFIAEYISEVTQGKNQYSFLLYLIFRIE